MPVIVHGEVIERRGDDVICWIRCDDCRLRTALPLSWFGETDVFPELEITWDTELKTVSRRTWDNADLIAEIEGNLVGFVDIDISEGQ